MRTAVIANPVAAAGKVQRRWPVMMRLLERALGETLSVHWTTGPGDGVALAARLVREGIERLVVVGGDGTVHEVVNGVLGDVPPGWVGAEEQPDSKPPQQVTAPCSVMPLAMGTGGDLARALGAGGEARGWQAQMVRDLRGASQRLIDVGWVETAGGRRWFVNEASLGASADVVRRVNAGSKVLGGRAAFLLGTVQSLAGYANASVILEPEGHDSVANDRNVRSEGAVPLAAAAANADGVETIVNTVVFANGRYFGGGMKIAPNACLDDGLLDVVVVGDIGLGKFLRYGPALYAGTHVHKAEVQCFRSGAACVRAGHGVVGEAVPWVECDGELVGQLPLRVGVLRQALPLWACWDAVSVVEV